MTSISNVSSAALAILQQLNKGTTISEQPPSAADSLIAVATGQVNNVTVSKQPTQAQSKVSEAMFSMSKDSIAKQKLDLIERTGRALGVERSDYSSMDEFVAAMKKVYGEIKVQAGGMGALHALERQLGLDKLGLTIEDVIESAQDGDSNDKVTKALERRAKKEKNEESGTGADQAIQIDAAAANLYGLLSFN
ncbi:MULTISPECIES: hypothetical protein [Rhizobium]|uniref:Uncharacterized protein n=1 Tax=Rhizobium tropici TaxID=398 RepID=A0A6P1CC73_RHITR|nr:MULTISPECIES: hypothetical protein [Rhizobium]AGB75144.1 hypothetical protein RTCIAT899_PC06765 [Rhizobium tropici CIAT 899]MBB4242909.1 hypothetical protein [Rhizobium tropici]MBB5594676.1 hypothetical protein [Rhizobium tropici]MBB6493234.1 hypothetical protein [Rhizobium tropici]NEV14031.1 hypothetical protein [Rhizobium tropici]